MNIIYSGYFVDDVDSLKKLFPTKHANQMYHPQPRKVSSKARSDIAGGKNHKVVGNGRMTDVTVDCLILIRCQSPA